MLPSDCVVVWGTCLLFVTAVVAAFQRIWCLHSFIATPSLYYIFLIINVFIWSFVEYTIFSTFIQNFIIELIGTVLNIFFFVFTIVIYTFDVLWLIIRFVAVSIIFVIVFKLRGFLHSSAATWNVPNFRSGSETNFSPDLILRQFITAWIPLI